MHTLFRVLTSSWAALLLVLALVSAGCDKPQKAESASTSAASSQIDAGLKYDEARTIIASDNLPQNPQRIVSLAPNVTEILFALGLGDRVVGVTNYCDYPPIVTALPKVGGFINPDVEMILAQKPDLVVGVTSAGNADLPNTLQEAGLNYAFMEIENIDQTREAIMFLGATTGAIAPAAKLVGNIDSQLDAWTDKIENPPTVIVVYGYKPLVAAGPGSFAHELVTRAGAKNVLTDQNDRYGQLDAEALMVLNPDVIVDAAMGDESEPPWKAYPNLTAVENGNVIKVSDPAVMRPGPRMVKGFAELAGAIQVAADKSEKE